MFENLNFGEMLVALESGDPMALAGFMGMIVLLVLIIAIPIYIYTSIAVMTIGRKAKVDYPGLAWIPSIGPALVFRKVAKMPAWPFWLFAGVLLFPLGLGGIIVGILALVAFSVFYYIWYWKTAEARNFPPWTILLTLVPVWGLGALWNLVLLGILAWKEN